VATQWQAGRGRLLLQAELNLTRQDRPAFWGASVRVDGGTQLGPADASPPPTLVRTLDLLGAPAVAAVDAWLQRAWIAILRQDEESLDRALGELGALTAGLDPKWLAKNLVDRSLAPPEPTDVVIKDPVLAAWVAVLADLRGHERMARPVLRRAVEDAERLAARGELSAACEEKEAKAASPDPRALLNRLLCRDPWIASPGTAKALRPLVRLRLQALLTGKGREWLASIPAAVRAAPTLVPPWVPVYSRAVLDGKPELLGSGPDGPQAAARLHLGRGSVRVAAENGYPCEAIVAALTPNPLPSVLDLARTYAPRCGHLPTRVEVLLQLSLAEDDPAKVYRLVEEALDFTARFQHGFGTLAGASWNEALTHVLNTSLKSSPAMAPSNARGLAARIAAQGEQGAALLLRVDALAVEAWLGAEHKEPPAHVLADAERLQVDVGVVVFLKKLIFEAPDVASRQALAQAYFHGRAP
jgi:hypothetical protein